MYGFALSILQVMGSGPKTFSLGVGTLLLELPGSTAFYRTIERFRLVKLFKALKVDIASKTERATNASSSG